MVPLWADAGQVPVGVVQNDKHMGAGYAAIEVAR